MRISPSSCSVSTERIVAGSRTFRRISATLGPSISASHSREQCATSTRRSSSCATRRSCGRARLFCHVQPGRSRGPARRRDGSDRLVAGWIPVVGMVDLQSALRTISGGIDFAYGLSAVYVSVITSWWVSSRIWITRAGCIGASACIPRGRASGHGAYRQTPITWIHGRHDAWMDVERVRHLMSCGDSRARRVIEVPTGHQLARAPRRLRSSDWSPPRWVAWRWGDRSCQACPTWSRSMRDAKLSVGGCLAHPWFFESSGGTTYSGATRALVSSC